MDRLEGRSWRSWHPDDLGSTGFNDKAEGRRKRETDRPGRGRPRIQRSAASAGSHPPPQPHGRHTDQ
jgi:hypothetical protein